MQHEEIIECPITGVEMCLKHQIAPDMYNYFSLSSGFWSNSLMKEGDEFYEQQMVGLPELYKELAFVDEKTGLTWLPNLYNEQEKGMVFASGSSKNDWKWKAVKAIKIPEKDRKKHPIPGKKGQYLEYKMDMENSVDFNINEYMMAINHLEVI